MIPYTKTTVYYLRNGMYFCFSDTNTGDIYKVDHLEHDFDEGVVTIHSHTRDGRKFMDVRHFLFEIIASFKYI